MHAPHERNESGPSSLNHTSCSSSSPSPRNRAPNTPPQIQLAVDAATASNGPGFSGFFPWVQHGADQSSHLKEPDAETAMSQPSYVTAFEQRDASYLPSDALQSTGRINAGQHLTPPQAEQNVGPSSSSDSYRNAALAEGGIPASQARAGHFRPFTDSSLDHDGERSPGMTHDSLLSPYPQARDAGTLVEGLPSQSGSSFVHTSMVASSSSPQQPQRQLSPANPMPFATIGSSSGPFAGTTDQEWSTAGEILDIFSDDQLPGYQVRTRGPLRCNIIVIRVPRQLMGWKAVLMDTSDLPSSCLTPEASVTKKARRSSKVLGKQGWEVRQEALKNSYDFRRGSGIWATMHAGHRLFKHDWHIIVKDGSRYVWRMDKTALALFCEDDDSKVGEFCKAVPSAEEGGGGRIGSFRFEGQRSRIRPGHTQEGTIFGLNLALASLVAVFGARGGHESVSAAFEPSTDPRRDVLEQKRQEEPDREEVMLALPRPGFARDAESVLSDTTDEDAGEPAEASRQQRGSLGGVSSQQRPHQPASLHSSGFRSPQIQTASERESTGKKKKAGGRKRFSSLFGRSSAPVEREEEVRRSTDRAPMTDAQRIARQYRTQIVMLGS